MTDPNLIDKFYQSLSLAAATLVDRLIDLADDHNLPLFLVGGPVRDLILGRPSLDLDIAVEGHAIVLALALAADVEGLFTAHAEFGTASVKLEDITLDLVTAREDTYARPGALPSVQTADIYEDLFRRDFTINAMALALNGWGRGTLLDPYHGLRDLEDGLIRVLHEVSFQDDATRILRAFRYAVRFGFRIEPQTLSWLNRDVRYVETISATRLHHEFVRIFAEDRPDRVLVRLQNRGALIAIHPAFSFGRPYLTRAFASLRDLNPHGAHAAYWPLLAWRLSEAESTSLARRLALTRAQRAALEAMPALRDFVTPRYRPRIKPSALVEMLAPFPSAALWAFAALTTGPVRERCLEYLRKLRHLRPILRGDDVLALGVIPGPQVGEVLRRLKAAKLDGEVKTRKDEEEFVRRLVKILPVRPEALEG